MSEINACGEPGVLEHQESAGDGSVRARRDTPSQRSVEPAPSGRARPPAVPRRPDQEGNLTSQQRRYVNVTEAGTADLATAVRRAGIGLTTAPPCTPAGKAAPATGVSVTNLAHDHACDYTGHDGDLSHCSSVTETATGADGRQQRLAAREEEQPDAPCVQQVAPSDPAARFDASTPGASGRPTAVSDSPYATPSSSMEHTAPVSATQVDMPLNRGTHVNTHDDPGFPRGLGDESTSSAHALQHSTSASGPLKKDWPVTSVAGEGEQGGDTAGVATPAKPGTHISTGQPPTGTSQGAARHRDDQAHPTGQDHRHDGGEPKRWLKPAWLGRSRRRSTSSVPADNSGRSDDARIVCQNLHTEPALPATSMPSRPASRPADPQDGGPGTEDSQSPATVDGVQTVSSPAQLGAAIDTRHDRPGQAPSGARRVIVSTAPS